jgi:hypothetical protein
MRRRRITTIRTHGAIVRTSFVDSVWKEGDADSPRKLARVCVSRPPRDAMKMKSFHHDIPANNILLHKSSKHSACVQQSLKSDVHSQ